MKGKKNNFESFGTPCNNCDGIGFTKGKICRNCSGEGVILDAPTAKGCNFEDDDLYWPYYDYDDEEIDDGY